MEAPASLQDSAPADDPPVSFKFNVVPRYINPTDSWATPTSVCSSRIAIHFHLFYLDLLDDFIRRFQAIPFAFDLFVSVPDSAPLALSAPVEAALRAALQPRLQNAVVSRVPNRGRDIAPFIIEFGKALLNYDIVGHFHTKKSPHNPQLEGWRDTIVELMFGPSGNPGGHVARIVGMLESDTKVVYAEGSPYIPREPTGWAGNSEIARDLLEKCFGLSIDDYPTVEFPEGAMFWARAAALRKLLELPLSYEDFPAEPIPADGTLAHALERLVLILAQDEDGACIRLHKSDSVPDYRYFEEAQDFSSRLQHADVKVLAYYLPQFHPIPENDAWHGVGFTEWTKVRAANPLFRGHFQQHIPHEAVGYYVIEDDGVLRRQASDMKKAGVYGQIFYHYWFNGKLILENPVKILLNNPDIEMPFCFCWANENWTRRWDGSEHEILLKQDYSEADARAFIRYLIPFFRDARYIKVSGRPVLFIYRATLIPIMATYLGVWRQECEAAGLDQPYVVVTLAAGANDPRDFGADAGAERVLYDWTAGKVPEITADLDAYAPLGGRVFSYDQMKEHYEAQPIEKTFTCFRSLVPNWDNTARYGTGAHLLHGSTPPKFQEWLEALIGQTKRALPPDRRFILVNAWNEWAEGAHLEADSRYGYAYLNAIGRALSNEPRPIPAPDSRHALFTAQAAERARACGAMMMVVHRWGGGTERNVNDLVLALARKAISVFFTRMDAERPGWVVVEEAGDEGAVALGTFDLSGSPEDYARLMRRLHVKHMHIHHLAGFPETASEWLQRACVTAETPYDISIHDYLMICPRVFLVGETHSYCGEPPLGRCETCIATLGSPFGRPSVDEWRARFGRLLTGARRRFAPNEDVAERFSKYFPRLGFTVHPHPEPRRDAARLNRWQDKHERGEPANRVEAIRNIAIVGHLSGHKGFDLVLRCAQFAEQTRAPIRFTIVGSTDHDAAFDALGNVRVLGRYNASEFLGIIERESPDFAFLSSVCPETYSFTLTESVAAGLYPVAFDLGALGRRIRSLGWGKLFPIAWLDDPQAVVRALLEVTPTPPPPSVSELADGADYSDVLTDYYGLEWRLTAPERLKPGAPSRAATQAVLRELKFEAPGGEPPSSSRTRRMGV